MLTPDTKQQVKSVSKFVGALAVVGAIGVGVTNLVLPTSTPKTHMIEIDYRRTGEQLKLSVVSFEIWGTTNFQNYYYNQTVTATNKFTVTNRLPYEFFVIGKTMDRFNTNRAIRWKGL